MSTQTVELSPGQKLLIMVSKDNERPTFHQYSYDELISLVSKGYKKKSKSKRSSSKGALASRQIALLDRAMRTGQWSTGATINTALCAGKLVTLLNELTPEGIDGLTDNALTILDHLTDASYHTSQPLRVIAGDIIQAAGVV